VLSSSEQVSEPSGFMSDCQVLNRGSVVGLCGDEIKF
jgi:hypothetical protein